MKCMIAVLAAAFLPVAPLFADGIKAEHSIILNAAELSAALDDGRKDVPFSLTATVIIPLHPNLQLFAVKDDTGTVTLHVCDAEKHRTLLAGNRVRVRGTTAHGSFEQPCHAICKTIEVLSHEAIPQPEEATAAELAKGLFDNRLVRFKGKVMDTFRDEIDPLWVFLVLKSGGESIYTCFISPKQENAGLGDLIGAEIAITGLYSTQIIEPRFLSGRYMLFSGRDAISVLRPAPADPFDVPMLTAKRHDHAAIINGMEHRRIAGRVIAVWHGDRLLLRTPEHRIVRVDLAERNPPPYGIGIEAVGYPETDLYRLNLSRAIWRTNDVPTIIEPSPVYVNAQQILNNFEGKPAVQISYHGKTIRLRGIVRSIPTLEHSSDRLSLECNRHIVPIDVSSCPAALRNVEIGCSLEVSGICLIETENWRPNAPFPHIEGFAVVVRTADDIRILSRPPWWTTGRLLAVIGTLLSALVGVFLWNRQLNRLAERRGRELTKETVARVTADLKVGERTRLAIELHDALSQNLTGAALEIETSDVLIDDNPAQAHHHLGIAAKTVKSCREELRNCLWDLRNDALGEKTMDEAIRLTLTPFLDGTGFAVRFNVPRERLSDDTAHAFLRIIRELAQNAIRHGHAKMVKIAGCLESDRLLFSVQDDGCGFDPENHPGVRQGHFGLQGIRERVNRFGGTVEIASAPGKGTKVSITIGTANREGKVLEEAVAHETNQSPAC